jgi:hypothetical protein
MPWCERCDRYLAPAAVDGDGRCTFCGRTAESESAVQASVGRTRGSIADRPADRPPLPWHFKLVAVAGAVYLLTRLVQGVSWVADRF